VSAAVLDADGQTLTPGRAGGGTAVTRPPHTVTPGWLRSHVRPANHASWDEREAALLIERKASLAFIENRRTMS
jgi:hypothetical protein